MTFTVIPLASILTETLEQAALLGPYQGALEALGAEMGHMGDAAAWRTPVFFLLTGGTEALALEAWKAYCQRVPRAGLVLLAHPGNNSLPAALETLARVQQEGAAGRVIYLNGPHDEAGWRALVETQRAFAVWERLTQTRLGVIGKPSDWLVASTPAPDVVREVWGPDPVPLAMEALLAELEHVPATLIAEALEELTREASVITEPQSHELEEAARVYGALLNLTSAYALDALTVRCFDLVLARRTTGCYALSRLTDAGVIAGCEGDVPGTLAMLWTQLLLDTTPWMANPARIHGARNALVLAHCTVARRLVTRYALRSHFESGVGVGLQGTFAPGPVTLLRIGGAELRTLWVAEGTLVPSQHEENLCRTQAEIELLPSYEVSDLLRHPLGNHVVVVRGHHAEVLRAWHETFIAKTAH